MANPYFPKNAARELIQKTLGSDKFQMQTKNNRCYIRVNLPTVRDASLPEALQGKVNAGRVADGVYLGGGRTWLEAVINMENNMLASWIKACGFELAQDAEPVPADFDLAKYEADGGKLDKDGQIPYVVVIEGEKEISPRFGKNSGLIGWWRDHRTEFEPLPIEVAK